MKQTFHLSQVAQDSQGAGAYAVCRLPIDSKLPPWAGEALAEAGFCSITRTAEELSVVCLAERVPEEVQAARDWVCFWLHGPFDFEQTGVLAALLTPLAEVHIGIFAISTYDTDYILVKQENAAAAMRVWRSAGHQVDAG